MGHSDHGYPFAGAAVRIPGLDATARHIGVMQRKIDQLLELRDGAWAQLLSATARGYADGLIDALDLAEALADMKASYGAGYTVLWNQHMPYKASQVPHRAAAVVRSRPNAPYGSWAGNWPHVTEDAYPARGVPVVYVLFDHLNRPAYVGSTDHFVARMKAHRKDLRKGAISRWTAYRCADREAAYVLEEKLLAEHKPYLNRRTTR